MSRIGKKVIGIPAGLKIEVGGKRIAVEGPLGKLDWSFRPEIDVAYDDKARQLKVTRGDETRLSRRCTA